MDIRDFMVNLKESKDRVKESIKENLDFERYLNDAFKRELSSLYKEIHEIISFKMGKLIKDEKERIQGDSGIEDKDVALAQLDEYIANIKHSLIGDMDVNIDTLYEKVSYTPPKSGDAPKGVKKVLKKVYSSCRKDNPGEIKSRKEKCSKIAWSAVKKAGWHKNEEGKWVKK